MYEIKNKSAKRGGKRSGAGRKSLYGAPTKAIRVPENMVAEIKDFIEAQNAAIYEPVSYTHLTLPTIYSV